MTDESITVALPEEALDAIAARAAQIVLERTGEHKDSSPWLTVSEAADYLRVSERTVHRMIESGRVSAGTVGRRRLLHRDDLDAVAAAGEDARLARHPAAAGARVRAG